MHRAAYQYVARAVEFWGPFARVVEIGSLDLNGSVRPLFATAGTYIGVDVQPGPGVDQVVDPALTWNPPRLVDAVVCCEVLEHVEAWPTIVAAARRWLRPEGLLILTAAGPGRRPHSGIDGRRRLHPGEWYANIDPAALEAELVTAGYWPVSVNVDGHDVRAVARRPPPTYVGVPFVDETDRTRALFEQLAADPAVDLILLADNGSTDPATLAWLDSLDGHPKARCHRLPPLGPDRSLYSVWNLLVGETGGSGWSAVNFALLNNDVRVPDGLVGHLARALRSAPPKVAAVYPDWNRPLAAGVDVTGDLTPTRGTWRAGGLSGFAFMFRAELVHGGLLPPFDERYEWIFGDGDWVEALEHAGFTAARVEGLPLEHDKSTTANRAGWTAAAKRRDVERRKAKVAERAG